MQEETAHEAETGTESGQPPSGAGVQVWEGCPESLDASWPIFPTFLPLGLGQGLMHQAGLELDCGGGVQEAAWSPMGPSPAGEGSKCLPAVCASCTRLVGSSCREACWGLVDWAEPLASQVPLTAPSNTHLSPRFSAEQTRMVSVDGFLGYLDGGGIGDMEQGKLRSYGPHMGISVKAPTQRKHSSDLSQVWQDQEQRIWVWPQAEVGAYFLHIPSTGMGGSCTQPPHPHNNQLGWNFSPISQRSSGPGS